jgi:hypothetical protein
VPAIHRAQYFPAHLFDRGPPFLSLSAQNNPFAGQIFFRLAESIAGGYSQPLFGLEVAGRHARKS